jgi:hypothetical protein
MNFSWGRLPIPRRATFRFDHVVHPRSDGGQIETCAAALTRWTPKQQSPAVYHTDMCWMAGLPANTFATLGGAPIANARPPRNCL